MVAAAGLWGCNSSGARNLAFDPAVAQPPTVSPEATSAFGAVDTPRAFESDREPAPRPQTVAQSRRTVLGEELASNPGAHGTSGLTATARRVNASEETESPRGALRLGMASTVGALGRTSVARAADVDLAGFDDSSVDQTQILPPETVRRTGFQTVPQREQVPGAADSHIVDRDEPELTETALEPRNEYPMDMSTALALVSGQNPQVGFARWRIQEAFAQQDAAGVLWLPSIQAGISYYRHDGNLQASDGNILDVNRSGLQAGFGAGAVGAGATQQPGLVARFHMVDAIFQPKIAQLTTWARGHGANAVLHDQLLEASLAYLELLEAVQTSAIAGETLQNTSQLAQLTADFARTGQGLQSDADRVQTELAFRRNDLVRAEEQIDLASARLAQAISLDAAYRITPVEAGIAPIDLVSNEYTLHQLVATGLSSRPELQESRALVAEACERLRREKYAALVPSILLGMNYNGFGGGLGGTIARFNDRAEFNALAFWEVRNLGFGERAARRAAGARVEEAKYEQVRIMDDVAREISEAHTQVQSARRQIDVAESAIQTARDSYDRNMNRIRQGQGLPIEALQSIEALDRARREYLNSVISYNAAQFRLHRALGWPIRM